MKVNLYITEDLAFYAMILVKESMSDHWSYLCKLMQKEFDEFLDANGEEWAYIHKEAFVKKIDHSGKAMLGDMDKPF